MKPRKMIGVAYGNFNCAETVLPARAFISISTQLTEITLFVS